MNALVLWVPGTALITVGALLLALARIDVSAALALIVSVSRSKRSVRCFGYVSASRAARRAGNRLTIEE